MLLASSQNFRQCLHAYDQQQGIPIGLLQRSSLLIMTKKQASVDSYWPSHNYPFETITFWAMVLHQQLVQVPSMPPNTMNSLTLAVQRIHFVAHD